MRRLNALSAAVGAVSLVAMSASQALAVGYTWSAGPGTQNFTTGWTPAGFPSAPADTATIPSLAGNLNINVDTTLGIFGTLTFGSTGFATDVGNSNATGNTLQVNNTGAAPAANASIVTTGNNANNRVTAGLILLGNTDFGVNSTTALTLGSITSSGGSRQINNNTVANPTALTAVAQTLTINGPLFVGEAGATTTRGLVINGSGTAAINNGNVIVNGAFNANGLGATLVPVTIGTTSTVNNLVRSTVTLNGDSSAFIGNMTLSRANTVLTNDNNIGTGRLLLGGSTNSVDAQVSSAGGTRTIGKLAVAGPPIVPASQLQIQQFNAFTGTNSFVVNSVVLASASRGLGNLISGGTLTLNSGFYSANTGTDLRNQIIDGSGNTIINGGLHNGFDQTNNIEFAGGGSAGSYEKRGTGVLTVNGTSTYLGATRVRGGSLEFATSAAYGVGVGNPNGITVDAGGTVALQTGSLDTTFLGRIALGGGSNFAIATPGGTTSTVSTDFTSNGALGLTNSDTATNVSYATGGNLSSPFLLNLGLGAVSSGANYAGSITLASANPNFRLGGGGTLTLTGTNQLTGANNVVANNGGTVAIAGTESYTGTTTIGGTYVNPSQELLRLGQTTSVITNPVSLRVNSTVAVGTLANGGAASSLGSSSSAASNLVLNGGTLRYTGAGSSTDRLFTVGANGATLDASGTGAVNFTNTGAVVSADAAGRSGISDSGTKTVVYVNDPSDLAIGMGVTGTGVPAGTTIRAIVAPSFSNIGGTSSVGPYQVILSAAVTGQTAVYTTIPDLAFTGQNRTLTLTGTSTAANRVAGVLSNSAAGTLGVTKNGAGTWTLAGANTYTGGTTVNAGLLNAQRGFRNALVVNAGKAAVLANGNGSNNGTSDLATLTLAGTASAPTASFDLGDNAAVIRNGTLATVYAQTRASFENGGNFDFGGPGITSSAAAARAQIDGATAVGVVSNDNLGYTTFKGVTGLAGTANEILLKYTYLGDSDLDGDVDGGDFTAFVAGISQGTGGWEVGDTDYNNVINGGDFTGFVTGLSAYQGNGPLLLSDDQIAGLYAQLQAGTLTFAGLEAAVAPEPASLATLAALAAVGLRRRRRVAAAV